MTPRRKGRARVARAFLGEDGRPVSAEERARRMAQWQKDGSPEDGEPEEQQEEQEVEVNGDAAPEGEAGASSSSPAAAAGSKETGIKVLLRKRKRGEAAAPEDEEQDAATATGTGTGAGEVSTSTSPGGENASPSKRTRRGGRRRASDSAPAAAAAAASAEEPANANETGDNSEEQPGEADDALDADLTAVPTLQGVDFSKPDRLLRPANANTTSARAGALVFRSRRLASAGAPPPAPLLKGVRPTAELLLDDEDRLKLRTVIERLERELGAPILSTPIPARFLPRGRDEQDAATAAATAEEEEAEAEAAGSADDSHAAPEESAGASYGRRGNRKKHKGWTTRKSHTQKAVENLAKYKEVVAGRKAGRDGEGDDGAGANENAFVGLDLTDLAGEAKLSLAETLPPPVVDLQLEWTTLGQALAGDREAGPVSVPVIDAKDFVEALAAVLRYLNSVEQRRHLQHEIEMREQVRSTIVRLEEEQRAAQKNAQKAADATAAAAAAAAAPQAAGAEAKAGGQSATPLPPNGEGAAADTQQPDAEADASQKDGAVDVTMEDAQEQSTAPSAPSAPKTTAVTKKELEACEERVRQLAILSVVDRLLSRIAARHRELEAAQLPAEAAPTAPALAEVPAVKKEEDVEAVLLRLAQADAAQDPKTGAELKPPVRQYALHMRLPGSDYFSNATYLPEDEALALDTGAADLVEIEPTSRRERDQPVPTLGSRIQRKASRRPPRPAAADLQRLSEPKLHSPSHLYYGPYASFAPSYDSTAASVSFGASLALRQAKIDQRRSDLRRRWLKADPEQLGEAVLGELDELLEDDVPEPSEPPALPVAITENLGHGLNKDALQAAFQQAHFEQRIEDRLKTNSLLISKLQQVQWERLRAHEREVVKDPLFRETTKYLVADANEQALADELLESLVDLLALRPRAVRGNARRSVLPSKEALQLVAGSNALDPALFGGEAEQGFWGTMPNTMHRRMPFVLKDVDTVRQDQSPETSSRAKYVTRTTGFRTSNKGRLEDFAGSRNYVGKTVVEMDPAVLPKPVVAAVPAAARAPVPAARPVQAQRPSFNGTPVRKPVLPVGRAPTASTPIGAQPVRAGATSMGSLVPPGRSTPIVNNSTGTYRPPPTNMPGSNPIANAMQYARAQGQQVNGHARQAPYPQR